MRRVLVLAATSLLLLAGCGQQTATRSPSDASSSASPSASADGPVAAAASQAWLLRFDSYVGEDGEGRRATYVSLVPSTGKTSVVRMPTVEPTQVKDNAVSLLVDAGHRWALADARTAAADRRRGVVRLYDLGSGSATPQQLSVRQAAGTALRTDWVSFDPTTPGLLRVVSGRDVWTVDVASRQAKREGTLPERAGWIYGGGFAKNTGVPYIEDTGSFDTLPAGNGDDDTSALQRGGGTVLDAHADQPYGQSPSPCEASSGYVDADGATWAFCAAGGSLQAKVLDPGATAWRDVGTATADVVPTDADPVFALPPSR